MIRLWGRANSSNVMKVAWLLDELGLPCERIDAGGPFGGTQDAAYRAMSPTGLVPALRDGDFTLFESNAILRYLCNAHAPDSPLYPAAARPRAVVEAWMEVQQTELGPPQGRAFQKLIRQEPAQCDAAAIGHAVREAGACWAMINDRLRDHAYIAGDQLTLADVALGPHVHRWFHLPIARADSVALRRWYGRLSARPAYSRHCTAKLS